MPHRTNNSVRDYASAASYLGSKRERPLGTGRATRLHRIDEHTIAVSYHWTDVVTYHDDGTATLNSGGFYSVTTKERINQYTNARLSQMNREWYVGGSEFYNGMIISDEGKLVSAPRAPRKAKPCPGRRVRPRLPYPCAKPKPKKDPPERPEAYWKIN
jgi:hypothetical protein